MKTTACRIGPKVVPVAMALLLVLGAGAALADGEPTDPDGFCPHLPPRCPDDPESDLPGVEWVDSGAGALAAAAVRLLVTIAVP